MLQTLDYLMLCFLVILSIIDWKFKEIPSVILTGLLIVVMVIRIDYLDFALISLMFSILLYEFDFIKGIGDIKVMTMLGFFIYSLNQLYLYILIVFIYGSVFIGILRFMGKKKSHINQDRENSYPFIPVFLFVFITFMILRRYGII